MRYLKIFFLASLAVSFVGCSKFLDRPQLTQEDDETAWNSEGNIRLYANKYYTSFFPGYGLGFSYTGAPLMDHQFSDDVFLMGNQGNFGRAVPSSAIWSYGIVRSTNIMINRLETRMKGILDQKSYEHWMGIARFFRGMEYQSLVNRYGDIPFYDYVPDDQDKDDLYKARTPRNEVMNAVYDDLKYAMEFVRTNDGDQYVNQYVVAGFTTRIALQEASWQKYYYGNNEQAKKFFELAVEAGDLLINSGRFDIVTEFRTLFTSNSLAGNRDVILYRHYDPSVSIMHAIASNNNLTESVAFGPTTALIKSFICTDGEAWQNSTVDDASDFTLANVIKTRDPRFEATFYDKPNIRNRASYWYINKFLPRSAARMYENEGRVPEEYTSSKNFTDYPVFRYAEALLNWIEAKAELASLGSGTVSQADIDKSINKIRNRPIHPEAVAMGVKKTADLKLANLPNDPDRDADVSPLMWEIRRERRMEFAFEYGRYQDLRRWKKLEYMDTDEHPDLLSGGWVNFPQELPSELVTAKRGQIAVVKLDGSTVVYDGSNNALMRGFYQGTNTNGRLPFLNLPNVNPYLSPVGRTQMDDYKSKGYTLTQTEGWPQE